MRKKNVLLAGNWKMNNGPKGTREFLEALHVGPKRAPSGTNATMRLYVPYISLTTAIEETKGALTHLNGPNNPLQIGAENIHFENSGAFTGEISGPMLQEIGVKQVLVGHSERRQYFGETDETVLKRCVSSLKQGFEVLVCIGETLAERDAKQTNDVLRTQLTRLLADETCKTAFGLNLHIAYEPVWAIGTGVVATTEQAQAAHAFIRAELKAHLPAEAAEKTMILYGGSVSPANFKELLACEDIDGGLVGGASLKVESWMALWNLIG